ncbi:MAG: tRNA 2-thiocytidine(32) synthetase TtcA, partial [candidate division Zixibacteria bacterium]|nr:tRNA 2-thiocytidine(32) synthetase TtcA [candidate division Zixibacteria bacterium]
MMAYFYKNKLEKDIAQKAVRASDRFGMIDEGDRIVVALSGGKDSFTLLRMLKLMQLKGNREFELMVINIHPGFEGYLTEGIETYLKENHFQYKMISYPIEKIAGIKLDEGQILCSFCSRLKRGVLYDACMKLGYNKLALGHNADDVIETLLMNQLYSGALRGMPPKLKADDKPITVIRPLYYVFEKDTLRYAVESRFPVVCCKCPICGTEDMKRRQVKQLLSNLEKDNPRIKSSLLGAAGNIHARFLS